MSELDCIDFLLPIYIDHPDRLRNLQITIKYLQSLGANNIIVNEHYVGEPKASNIVTKYMSKDITNDSFYNKMLCGNEMFERYSTNKIVGLYDIDVLIPKRDLKLTIDMILNQKYQFVYPYDGRFYDIPLETVLELQKDLKTQIDLSKCTLFCTTSHGGCVFFDRDCFIEGGKLNPNFKNVGFDDDEINVRFSKLEYKKGRTFSPLLHLTHFRGATTYNHNKFNDHNGHECGKISRMTKQEIKNYINNNYANS